jgi:hypothetical protein
MWVGGEGWVKVLQPEPRREVYFSGPAAQLWEWLDAQESTVAQLIARMAEHGVPADRTHAMLERLRAMQLISAESSLWREETV